MKPRKKKKQTQKAFTNKDMVEELEFSSKSESSEDGLAKKVLNLPSSSGTTILVGGDEADDEVSKLPLGKSWNPIEISPPKLPLSRLLRGPRDPISRDSKTLVSSPVGETTGASSKEKESAEGTAVVQGYDGEGMDADHVDVEGKLLGSGAELKEVVTLNEGSNCQLKEKVNSDVGEEMEVGEAIVGEGKGYNDGITMEEKGNGVGTTAEEKHNGEGLVVEINGFEQGDVW